MKQRKMSFIIVMAALPYTLLFVGLIVLIVHLALANTNPRILADDSDLSYQIEVTRHAQDLITAQDNTDQEYQWRYTDGLSGAEDCADDLVRDYHEGDTIRLSPRPSSAVGTLFDSDERETEYSPICFLIEKTEGQPSVYRYDPQSIPVNPGVVFTVVGAILLSALLFIYPFIWLIKTKGELVQQGADIPTSWLLIVPFANYYYVYKYGDEAQRITGGSLNGVLAMVLFFFELLPVMMMVYQGNYNKFQPGADRPNIPPPGFGNTSPTISQLSAQTNPQPPPTTNPNIPPPGLGNVSPTGNQPPIQNDRQPPAAPESPESAPDQPSQPHQPPKI